MKSALPATALLVAILSFCLWNSRTIESSTARWQENLQEVAVHVQAQDWPEAQSHLQSFHEDWENCQPYLRTVSTHAVLDDVDELYCRVLTYSAVQDQSHLLAVLSDLQDQLKLLSDREQLTLTNIF